MKKLGRSRCTFSCDPAALSNALELSIALVMAPELLLTHAVVRNLKSFVSCDQLVSSQNLDCHDDQDGAPGSSFHPQPGCNTVWSFILAFHHPLPRFLNGQRSLAGLLSDTYAPFSFINYHAIPRKDSAQLSVTRVRQ